MNSTVGFWTSGLLCGSPYDLVTGLYMNSSGTEQQRNKKSQDRALNNGAIKHVD